MKLHELQAKRADHIKAAQSIRDKAKAENREDLTDVEIAEIEGNLKSAADLKTHIDRKTRLNALDAEIDNQAGDLRKPAGGARVEGGDTAISSNLKERVQNDPKRGFRSFGEFGMNVQQLQDPRTQPHEKAEAVKILSAATGMNQATGADGGILVPPAFSTNIWDGLNTDPDNFMSMCDQYTVEGESLTIPANAETNRTNGNRYGGIRGYWLNEAKQLTGSAVKFRQMKLEPQEMGILCYVTDKLLRNATALGQYLSKAARGEIVFMSNDAIVRGDGVGKPVGFLNSDAIITVSKETSQAVDTFVSENVSKMWQRLHPNSRKRAVWLMNPDVEPQLDLLNVKVKNVAGTENVGGFTNVVYNADKGTLKGRPIIFSELMETIGDLGDIALVDLQGYALGVNGGVDEAMSMHLRFDYAETAFRFLFRIDGQSWLKSALTPYKGSNTLSTFIKLEAR
jgi:HK97 family phage major capsid protein